MKYFNLALAVILIVAFYNSCRKETLPPASQSFNYFPTDKGRYVEYNVDSVYHAINDNNTDDSVYAWHYQLKELIDSTFIDGEGRKVQIIKRFRRDNDTLEWIETGSPQKDFWE